MLLRLERIRLTFSQASERSISGLAGSWSCSGIACIGITESDVFGSLREMNFLKLEPRGGMMPTNLSHFAASFQGLGVRITVASLAFRHF
jgi:hypothetical protein